MDPCAGSLQYQNEESGLRFEGPAFFPVVARNVLSMTALLLRVPWVLLMVLVIFVRGHCIPFC